MSVKDEDPRTESAMEGNPDVEGRPSFARKIWCGLGYTIGIFLLLALQYRLWFSDVGYLAQREIREEIRRTEVRNAKLESRNREVAREIEALSGDLTQIESEVRQDLGMVGEDETLYRLRPEPGDDGSE